MQLSRRGFFKSIIAAIAAASLLKEKSVYSEHFYVKSPIIVGHDMDIASEYARFTGTINRAIANGYSAVSMDDLLWPLVVGLPLEIDKPFLVTLDDGYKSQLNLLDFFAEKGIKAAFYVLPQYQDSTHQYIAEEEYTIISEAGHSVQPHTTKHRDMTAMSLEDAVNDALLAKQIIEEKTGIECRSFAYPYGRFDDALAEALSRHFISAVSTAAGISLYKRMGGKIRFRNSATEHYPENVMCLNRVYSF